MSSFEPDARPSSSSAPLARAVPRRHAEDAIASRHIDPSGLAWLYRSEAFAEDLSDDLPDADTPIAHDRGG